MGTGFGLGDLARLFGLTPGRGIILPRAARAKRVSFNARPKWLAAQLKERAVARRARQAAFRLKQTPATL